jgi:predicted nucleic acid-binding protein
VVIVDTTVWIDYFNGAQTPEVDWLDFALDRHRLGITSLNLCEVLQGLTSEKDAVRVRVAMARLEVFDTVTADVAMAAAFSYRALRRRGITVRKTIDLLIASFCIHGHHALLHSDRDFDAFERYLGLAVVHP